MQGHPDRCGSWRVRAAALAFLLALLVVSPIPAASAASPALPPWTMVDLDGRAAPNDCSAQTPTFRRIQDAIDASLAGDRISVCPGVYPERIRFDATASGVSLDSEDSFQATLAPPPAETGPAITIDGATDVRVRGLRIRTVGTITPLIIPVLSIAWVELCQPAGAAISIQGGANATIRGVRITTQPECGYDVGIDVVDSVATLAFDQVTDFLTTGIRVGPGSSAEISRSDIRFLHAHRKRALPGNHLSEEATGIVLDGVASGHISRSGVFSVLPRSDRVQPSLWAGIVIKGARGPVSVWRTRVFRTIQAGYLVTDSPGVILSDVRVRANFRDGIVLDDLSGAVVRSGQAINNGRGITLGPGTSDVRVIALRVHGSRVLDCHDGSAGDGSAGTANVWTRVIGASSDPPGLCHPRQVDTTP